MRAVTIQGVRVVAAMLAGIGMGFALNTFAESCFAVFPGGVYTYSMILAEPNRIESWPAALGASIRDRETSPSNSAMYEVVDRQSGAFFLTLEEIVP